MERTHCPAPPEPISAHDRMTRSRPPCYDFVNNYGEVSRRNLDHRLGCKDLVRECGDGKDIRYGRDQNVGAAVVSICVSRRRSDCTEAIRKEARGRGCALSFSTEASGWVRNLGRCTRNADEERCRRLHRNRRNFQRFSEAKLVGDAVLFVLGAKYSVDGVGRAPARLVVVTHLHLSKQPNC